VGDKGKNISDLQKGLYLKKRTRKSKEQVKNKKRTRTRTRKNKRKNKNNELEEKYLILIKLPILKPFYRLFVRTSAVCYVNTKLSILILIYVITVV